MADSTSSTSIHGMVARPVGRMVLLYGVACVTIASTLLPVWPGR